MIKGPLVTFYYRILSKNKNKNMNKKLKKTERQYNKHIKFAQEKQLAITLKFQDTDYNYTIKTTVKCKIRNSPYVKFPPKLEFEILKI